MRARCYLAGPPGSSCRLSPGRRRRFARVAGALVLAFAPSASAESEIDLQFLSMKRVVEKAPGGLELERLVPVSELYPGDEIKYSVAYTNRGDEAALAVKITLPIPAGMKLIPGSVERPGVTVGYSVDGGATFAPLEQLSVTPPGGKPRPARPSDVQAVRWRIDDPVPAGASGTVGCVVLVE